jgi:DUF4097 and DUF4098 domain-containing protein YvlB
MERTFETPGKVRLLVTNEVGHVVITTHPTTATSVALEPETPDAEELIAAALVDCRAAGDGFAVMVKVPRQHGLRLLRRRPVTVRVALPERSDVMVESASADIEISGPVGLADLKTASGDVSTDDVEALQAKSASGDITVGNVAGNVRVATASGDLRCSSVAGSAEFSTTSGDIEVGAAGERVEVKATSGKVRLGELARGARVANVSGDVRVLALEEGRLQVRSVSGNVSVAVASGVDLHVDVETLSGTVSSEIPLDDRPPSSRRNVHVELSVRSVSGDVEIARALEQVA